MNPFLSVRFRLFALCVGLLAVMGGANLLLDQINRAHEGEVAILQEQYRRVDVIFTVQQAMVSVRFWQGQVNTAVLVKNKASEERAGVRLEEARAYLDARLAELAQFDATGVEVVGKAFNDLSSRLHEGVAALARSDPTAESYLNEATRLVNTIEDTLRKATQREQALAEAAQRSARERAARSKRLSTTILIASGLFGLVLVALVVNSIIRPMQTTIRALRLVNVGETAIDLPPVGPDEFGDMAIALRQFRDQAEKLRNLAYRDPLTGIGNRARFEEELRAGLDACRQRGTQLALFYIDVDNFSVVNDSLGHSAGDRYLSEAVERLARFIPEDALLCRYGGDKFTMLLQQVPNGDGDALRNHLRGVADQILTGMVEPFELGGDVLPMSVSLGIAVFPFDGSTSEQLLSSADAAMYLAKRRGRNNAQFATPELTGDARRQLANVADIRRALQAGEFEPFYQPVINVETGAVAGVEALLRWNHPQRGLLTAGEFVPAAEASGLIDALGEQCMTKACAQAGQWRSGRLGEMRVSVNLSARQIEDRTALTIMQRLHADVGEAAKWLDFEITETAILQHIDRAQETLNEIRALGHQLSVDDFGTGYSSLVYLQRFPVNRIKVDRSFVAKLGSSRESVAIISATVALARSLDLDVVAEGVETADQMARLRALGCTLQQGFYFTAALPPDELEAWCLTEPRKLLFA